MAFEDDMIEAGYSDEQGYLDHIMDDFERDFQQQQERELEYDNYDSSYDEEYEEEHSELMREKEEKKLFVLKWKKENPDSAIIFESYYSRIVAFSKYSEGFSTPDEYSSLIKWLENRSQFEKERKEKEWVLNKEKLFSQYKQELFNYYFPEDEIFNLSIVLQMSHELQFIIDNNSSLWENNISKYVVIPRQLNDIEDYTFWQYVYKRKMLYEFWKDTNAKEYNLFIKKWITNNSVGWNSLHEGEKKEWIDNHHELFLKYKTNYEIREKNKIIESIIEEYNINGSNLDEVDIDEFDEDDLSYFGSEVIYSEEPLQFLPDNEEQAVILYDINNLDNDLIEKINIALYSLDKNRLDIESDNYAEKVLTQLWLFTNNDEWCEEIINSDYERSFIYGGNSYDTIFQWWKNKNPDKWLEIRNTKAFEITKGLELLSKFSRWAYDGNKDYFISLADRYLPCWMKTIKLMYGEDIYEQIQNYSRNPTITPDKWEEDIDYIKKIADSDYEIEVWKKELSDMVVWNFTQNNKYKEHLCIDYVYSSL